MPDTSLSTPVATAASQLRLTYDSYQLLLEAQPVTYQHFLKTQARQLAEALAQREHGPQVRFALPDQLVVDAATGETQPIPAEFRDQLAGGLIDRLTRAEPGTALRQRLGELEQSPNRAIATAAGLIRHATALHLVHDLLPAGRTVVYRAAPGEEIPTIPDEAASQAPSALTAATDAIAEQGGEPEAAGRGELLVPFSDAARRFYLPQWVAFNDDDSLLVKSASEAEAHVASMQRFVALLHAAVALAPYIVADEVYQQKRYGMLGQLINQGRALARYQVREIVQTIARRASAQDLNRGLSLSLPYFDDQALHMATHAFEIIPAGRIMFVPAFIVRAAREEQAKVAQDTRLNASTRQHLLGELRLLETAFA
jgi:hypothetical protein